MGGHYGRKRIGKTYQHGEERSGIQGGQALETVGEHIAPPAGNRRFHDSGSLGAQGRVLPIQAILKNTSDRNIHYLYIQTHFEENHALV